MRIIEAINRIDSLKHNTYTQPEKIAWLSTLDSMAKAHVIDTHEGGENVTFSGYDQNTDLNTVLLIPAPYEEAYIKWLEAQIDYANGEYSKYNNAIESFNTFWNAYKNYYNRTHRPLRNHVRYFGGNRNPGAGSPGNPGAMAQILGMIGDLKKLNTEDKSSLVAAINEVLRKGADPEEVERIVGAYLAENGIGGGIQIGPYPPDDPNVDIWLDTSEEETPPYIPNTINAKPGQIVRVVTVDENGAIVAVEAVDMPSGGESYELPAATAETLGGVKAEPATEADTQPVRIGEDNKLYTIPGGNGGGEVWETINEAVVEDVVMTELDCNFDDYKKVAIMLDGFGTKTAGKVNAHFGYADSDTTKQICQFIGTTDDKRCGYILIDTVLGQIVYTASTNWAQAGCNLITLPDGLSARNYIGATKVKIIAIDSAGGGANPSTSNTMMGKIKIVGVRK